MTEIYNATRSGSIPKGSQDRRTATTSDVRSGATIKSQTEERHAAVTRIVARGGALVIETSQRGKDRE